MEKTGENSEVLPKASVAVAVTATLDAELNEMVKTPDVSGVTAATNVCPSPLPDGSDPGLGNVLVKISTVILLGDGVSTFPVTVMVPGAVVTEVKTGKLSRLFGPLSVSPLSLGVTPLFPRSIPRPAFRKIELREILFFTTP